MNSLTERLESFKSSHTVKKTANAKTSVSVRWEHPEDWLATPDTLAEAGFYFNPGWDARDNVKCFTCGKELDEWTEEDCPFRIHWTKCRSTCAWAIVRCGLIDELQDDGRFVFKTAGRVPSSKAMEKARLETFKDWPHDLVKGHGATSKKMAAAGFVYTPQPTEDGADTATCLYCLSPLGGWDNSDRPIDEHRKRTSKCAFFTGSLESKETKAAPKAKANLRASTRGKKPPPSSEDDEEEKQEEQEVIVVAKTKPKTKGKAKVVEENMDTEEEEPPKPTRRLTRTASGTRAGSKQAAASEDEQPVLGRSLRGRPKKVVELLLEEEEKPSLGRSTRGKQATLGSEDGPRKPSSGPPAAAKTTCTKRAPKSRVEVIEEEDEPPAKATLGKSTRKKKPKAEEPEPKPKAKTKPVKKKVVDSSSEEEEEEDERLSTPPPPPPTKKKSMKPKAPPMEVSDGSVEEPSPLPPPRQKMKKKAEAVAAEAPSPPPPPMKKSSKAKAPPPPSPPVEVSEDDDFVDAPEEMQVDSPPPPPPKPLPKKPATTRTTKTRAPSVRMAKAKTTYSADVKRVEISTDEDEPPAQVSVPVRKATSETPPTRKAAAPRKATPEPPHKKTPPPSRPSSPMDVNREPMQVDAGPIEEESAFYTMPHVETVVSVAASLFETSDFTPPLAWEPLQNYLALSELDMEMTVEDWVRKETSLQYQSFEADGRRRMRQFRDKAEEVRRVIEALPEA